MADISRSFSAEGGISLDDQVGIFTGTIDPSVSGEVAPLGSIFVRQNGQLFQKVGVQDSDWIRFTQGLGEGIKITAVDTTSGYLNSKLLVSSSITKIINNVGGNETLTLGLSTLGTAGTYKSITTNSEGRVISGTNPTTLAGYGITDAQPLDSTLSALSAFNSNGLLVQSAADTFVSRTITGTTNQITVSNGNGISGNPTLSFPSTILFPGTTGVRLPSGTTAQRVNTTAYTRFNNETSRLEYYSGSQWISLDPSTGGTVTSIAAQAPSSGLTISGSPITTSGNLVFSLANDLAAIESLSTIGFSARINEDQWVTRTLTGTPNRITISNGDGVSSDPTIDIASNYSGQSSISTVGTVTSGTWQASTLGTQYGGTGRTTIGSANTILGVNTGGTALEYKAISAGAGINLAFASQSISIANTGVLAIVGTLNQITATGTGAVTLSLPQNIHTAATPTFASVSVASDPTLPLQLATKQYVDNKVQGIVYKSPVKAASHSHENLSGLGNIDGVNINTGDRILLKNQTNPAENGVYVASSGTWTRSSDLNSWEELYAAAVFVEEGDLNANTSWYCASPETGVLDTDAITWVLFFKSGQLIAGTGLTKTGNILSISNIGSAGTYNNVTTNAQGQVISGSNVSYLTGNQPIVLSGDATGSGTNAITVTLANTGVTAGTYKSVTVNAKGLILGGTNPTTLAGYGITDAQSLSAFLTSLSSLASNGIVIKNGNSSISRSIAAASSKISITNADGVAGNPTIDVVENNISINNLNGTLAANRGGTGLNSIGTANQIFGVNAAGNSAEYKTITGSNITVTHSANSILLSAVNNGTVTSVSASGSTGLAVSGSPITSSGTLVFTLSPELQGLSSLSTVGIVTRTAANTYTSRSLVSGAGTISITNPTGATGNFGIDLSTVGTSGTYKIVTTDVHGRVVSGSNPTTLSGFGITDAVNISSLGAANGVATLDSLGKLNISQLPATAITDTYVVASQTEQTSLVAEVGDIAVRTDISKTFILKSLPATNIANWQELLNPTNTNTGTVTSVGITTSAGLSASGSPITTSGNIALSLSNDIAAVEALSTTGIAVRTGTDTWATRTLVAGTGITLTNANGVNGNITINSTGTGTVTSVGLTLPSIFSVTGSPITSSGTLTAALTTQAANTVFAGSTVAGQNITPSFRTLGLAQGDLNDVTITSATANQTLVYNGTRWVNASVSGANASGLIGAGQSGSAAWVLQAANTYTADFVHNLGTSNVVISVYDSATNTIVIPDSVIVVNTNTVRVKAIGNTRTLKVVVIANGQSIVAGGSTPSSVIVAKDGVTVNTATKLNFIGATAAISDAGANTANISFGARYSYYANSLDSPNNADFAVNALAPVTTDPSFNSLNVRSFSNVTEQGVAFTCSIPPGATQVTFKYRGRAQTAQAVASVVQPRLYARQIPNNSALGAWGAAVELPNISIPTNANFQYAQNTVSLSSIGLTADRLYQFELTRRVSGVSGTNLASNFLLIELVMEFA